MGGWGNRNSITDVKQTDCNYIEQHYTMEETICLRHHVSSHVVLSNFRLQVWYINIWLYLQTMHHRQCSVTDRLIPGFLHFMTTSSWMMLLFLHCVTTSCRRTTDTTWVIMHYGTTSICLSFFFALCDNFRLNIVFCTVILFPSESYYTYIVLR